MKKLLIICFFTAVLSGNNILIAQTSSLDSLIARTIAVSPGLKMYEAKKNAALSFIPQVSNLPDPMLTLGVMNLPINSFSFNKEPMSGKIIGLSQEFPFPGKLSAAENMGGKDVDIIGQEIIDEKNNLRKEFSDAYYELSFIRKSIQLTNESKKLLKDISKVVSTKYSVSQASQQNLIAVELEITKLNDQIEELNSKEASLLGTLNGFLLQDSKSPVFTSETGPMTDFHFSMSKLDSMAISNRPMLKGLKLSVQKTLLMEKLAEYQFYPNFNISLQYTQRDKLENSTMPSNDLFSAMVGISLPINYGGKKSAGVEEARSMQTAYNEQYSAAIQSLNIAFSNSLAKINEYKTREKLITEGMQPQAMQSFNSALASYQVGEIDFINVIDAQKKLYEIETNLYLLRTEYLKEINKLEFLTGTNLSKEIE